MERKLGIFEIGQGKRALVEAQLIGGQNLLGQGYIFLRFTNVEPGLGHLFERALGFVIKFGPEFFYRVAVDLLPDPVVFGRQPGLSTIKNGHIEPQAHVVERKPSPRLEGIELVGQL